MRDVGGKPLAELLVPYLRASLEREPLRGLFAEALRARDAVTEQGESELTALTEREHELSTTLDAAARAMLGDLVESFMACLVLDSRDASRAEAHLRASIAAEIGGELARLARRERGESD